MVHGRPVDASGNARESCCRSFDQIHERARDDRERKNGGEEHCDLETTAAHRFPEHLCFAQIVAEFEDAKNAEQTTKTRMIKSDWAPVKITLR